MVITWLNYLVNQNTIKMKWLDIRFFKKRKTKTNWFFYKKWNDICRYSWNLNDSRQNPLAKCVGSCEDFIIVWKFLQILHWCNVFITIVSFKSVMIFLSKVFSTNLNILEPELDWELHIRRENSWTFYESAASSSACECAGFSMISPVVVASVGAIVSSTTSSWLGCFSV